MPDKSNMPVPPNGGWGWVVVLSVCLINMFNQALMSVFGLLFGDLLISLGEKTTGAALLHNLNCVALNFSGLFIGPAIKNFSPRKVAFVGCLLTSSGLFVCAFATELWHVIIGYSCMFGVGLGLIAPSGFMAINSYFTTKRGIAVGISLAGTGFGQMTIPHVVRLLLEYYHFRFTMIVMACLAFSGAFAALTFRPLKNKPKHNNMKEMKLLLDSKAKQDFDVKIVKSEDIKAEVDLVPKDEPTEKPKNKCFQKLVEIMDLELMKDPIFIIIIVGMSMIYVATQSFLMLFPYFLQYGVNISRADTAMCMSVLASTDLAGRLIIPLISDKLRVPYRMVFLLGTIGLFISRAVIAESTNMTGILIASAFYGLMKASTVVTNNLTISDYVKQDKLAGALGLNMIFKGILVFSLGQLLGWIRDHANSYSLCLHSQNILLSITIVFWVPEMLYKYMKSQRANKNSEKINDSFS